MTSQNLAHYDSLESASISESTFSDSKLNLESHKDSKIRIESFRLVYKIGHIELEQ